MNQILFERVQLCLGPPSHWGPRANCPCCPPLPRRQHWKEALHIQMTPREERFNRDGGLEVPGCWTGEMRKQGGRSNSHQPLTSNDVYPQQRVCTSSGGFRGGLSHWRTKRFANFWVATPTFGHAGSPNRSNSRPSQMSGDQ